MGSTHFSGPLFVGGVNVVGAIAPPPPGTDRFVNASATKQASGKDWDHGYTTITAAIAAASDGDRILVAPGEYDETVTVNKGVQILGCGPRGAVCIAPSTAGAEGMQVTHDDVTIDNIGIAGDSAADYALNLHAVARFRASRCKIEGPDGTVVLMDGTATDQCADILLDDCEICWGGSGVLFDNSSYGYPTQIFLKDCRFHNLTAVHVGLASGGGVSNLHLIDCIHDNAEDGTAPTDYIKVDRSGDSGIISGCRFATATNATGVLTIAAGIMWTTNATEAGWSTARPA